MIAGIYNITCEQGTTFLRHITLEYPDVIDPSIYHPFDLAGYTARMQIRRTITTSTPMIELNTENGGIVIFDATNGRIAIHMTAEQTSTLTSDGVYDIELLNGDLEVSRLIQGAFTLSLEVTR